MPKANQNISPLLVFAVAGRIGSGCSFVGDSLIHALASYGYTTEKIKVTSVLEKKKDKKLSESEKIAKLQKRGSKLRRKKNRPEELIQKCLQKMVVPRIKKKGYLTGRHALIIDSVKHPSEIDYLRQLFQQAFYLVGVVASDRKREERLHERKGITKKEIERLSDIDAGRRPIEATQETVKTVTLADYFFKNDYATRTDMNSEADRLMRRIFDVGIDTPRQDEYGMHVAYQASLRSACLSRQVGAAIFDKFGVLLSTGHNDVPRFGGGLYGMEQVNCCCNPNDDKRCWAFGAKCYNDIEKELLARDICKSLVAADILKKKKVEDAVEAMVNSRIDQLIEFSRAVHAEMEAIIGIGRTEAAGLVGSTLYSTTYPCHNCAKHIIDAGITRVVYREPYEKSLARKLHVDALDDASHLRREGIVLFEAYGGVGPSRYEEFFKVRQKRKVDSGGYRDRDRDRIEQLPVGASYIEDILKRLDRVPED